MGTGKSNKATAAEKIVEIRTRFLTRRMQDWYDPNWHCQEVLQELVDNFNMLPDWAYAELIQMAKELLEDANGLAKEE